MVPAAVLTATGIALAQTGAPSTLTDRRDIAAVPDRPLHQPERTTNSVEQVDTGGSAADPGVAPGLQLPVGVLPGSAQQVRLDGLGIPSRARAAYLLAARLVDAADPGCGIDWALVGAIGRVESDHAQYGGNHLDAAGIARPGIFGVPLDGSRGTARITDTDGGRWDRDTVYDRAVGPMQFIPGTWRVVGSDADGDGARNPQDMADAATSTAVYLCSGPGDLREDVDLYRAVRRYNNSDSYARTVIAIADAYRHGVSMLPASGLPAAHAAGGSGGAGGFDGSGGSRVEAAGAPGGSTPAGAAASSGTADAGSGDSRSGSDGNGPGPGTAPTSGSVPPAGGVVEAAGQAATSAVASVTSVVTSVVTSIVNVPTVLPCLNDLGLPLPINLCPTTTVPVTQTATTTKTVIGTP